MSGTEPLPGRLSERIEIDAVAGCWLWTGALHSGGYGQVRWDGRTTYVHRLTYELLIGPIPEGLQIDHLCRVRRCVNPDHLEPVTQHENLLRGLRGGGSLKTHCPQGHPYDESNTYRNPSGSRACRICRRNHIRNFKERRRLELSRDVPVA